jgi:hypothetical protein
MVIFSSQILTGGVPWAERRDSDPIQIIGTARHAGSDRRTLLGSMAFSPNRT